PLASALRRPFDFGGAAREPDPGFDPLDHVRLHDPAADFHAAAGPLMERPLERTRPPWEAHVLPGADGASFAVLFKFHHALADGLRALTLAAALMDPVDLPAPRPRPVEPPRGLLPDVRKVPDLLRGALSDAGRALDIGAAVARSTLAMRPSPALACVPSGTRRTAGVVIDLDDVHEVRKSVGGTVNDVLIAVVAGALRRWFDERGDGPLHQVARAEYYLAANSPRIELPKIQAWLAEGSRLPQAEQMGNLGLTRGLMSAPYLPPERDFVRQPYASKRVLPDEIRDGTMPETVGAAILDRIVNDDPDGARQLLDGVDAMLSPPARAEWRQRVAWSYYIENNDPAALAMALTVREGSGPWVAEGDWVAGLAAWRMGDCGMATDAFRRAASGSTNNELTAAAYYW
ncbi:wax ester/triacylglycerol synthase domain-containing protein, partial [Streptomyces sp. G35A]